MHRWFGLILCLFLLGFCISGIVLNHPESFAGINVSRSIIPESYEYKDWNQGLMRGTIAKGDSVIIYGSNGFSSLTALEQIFATLTKACLRGLRCEV